MNVMILRETLQSLSALHVKEESGPWSSLGDSFPADISDESTMLITDIARICHEANAALSKTDGDYSHQSWDDAPDEQKASAINGVQFLIDNPEAGPGSSHANWMKKKIEDGWTWGPVKDSEKKTHPSLVLFGDLPRIDIFKDELFVAIVRAMTSKGAY